MAGRPEPIGREGVADAAEPVLGRARGAAVDDLRAKDVSAEARVLLGLLAPEPMVHVEGRGRVAELPGDVEQAGRIGAAGDEADDLAAARDQVVAADVPLDAGS